MAQEGRQITHLGENVGFIIFGSDGKNNDATIGNFIAEVMVDNVDRPRARTHLWNVGDLKSSRIVFKDLAVDARNRVGWYKLLVDFFEKVHEVLDVSRGGTECQELTFKRGKCELSLQ